jgi:hypothetical protein
MPWTTKPTCTNRVVEVLRMICASDFTIGEIIFLFTLQEHLDGDDPFRLPLRHLNDELQCRARNARCAYLCSVQRVPLPHTNPTAYAQTPRDLSDLLLQDVQTGMDIEISRIDDGFHAVVGYVQRGKLGVESTWSVTLAFEKLWNCRFETFNMWQAWKRRQVYGENWLQWEEMKTLERHEGSKLLIEELCRKAVNIAEPGRSFWSPEAICYRVEFSSRSRKS